tara:strand:- start:12682 stop:13026 length:345 start_codon:yes stop_codon:yes gene_type:complete
MPSRYRKPLRNKKKYEKTTKRSIDYKNYEYNLWSSGIDYNLSTDNSTSKQIYNSPPISLVNNVDEYITDIDYSNNSLFVSLESVIYGKKVNFDYCKDFNVRFYWINPFIKVMVY